MDEIKEAPESNGFGQLAFGVACRSVGIKPKGPAVVFVTRGEDSCPKCAPALDVVKERIQLGGQEVVRQLPVKLIQVSDQPRLAVSFGVTETPGILFIRDRDVVTRFDGIVPSASAVDEALGKILKPTDPRFAWHCQAPCMPPCDRPVHAHGLCMAHYVRLRDGLPLDVPVGKKGKELIERVKPLCTAPCNPPCNREARAMGLCQGHYARYRRGGDISQPLTASVARQLKEDKVGAAQAMHDLAKCMKIPVPVLRKALKKAVAEIEQEGGIDWSTPANATRQRRAAQAKLPPYPG